jgi:hypothetical protein
LDQRVEAAMQTLYPGQLIESVSKGTGGGTISFFGHTTTPSSFKVLVSCNHVLIGNGKPDTVCSPGPGPCACCCPSHVVGKVEFGFEGKDQATGLFIDTAAARLNNDVVGSNWILGREGKDRSGKAVGGALIGTAQAEVGKGVTVYGAATGAMPGIVKLPKFRNTQDNTEEPIYPPGVIVVDVGTQFARRPEIGSGDSGGPIVNEFNELVGIMFGRDDLSQDMNNKLGKPPYSWILGCQIEAVLGKLGVVFEPATTPAAAPLLQPPPERGHALLIDDLRRAQLKEIVRESPTGLRVLEAGLAHAVEVADLVHHCRPVTVAWHRAKGPAWTAHLLNSWRDPSYVMPDQVEGITRAELLERMRRALSLHASSALVNRMGENAAAILAVAGLARIRDMLQQLGVGAASIARLEAALAGELVP